MHRIDRDVVALSLNHAIFRGRCHVRLREEVGKETTGNKAAREKQRRDRLNDRCAQQIYSTFVLVTLQTEGSSVHRRM